MEATSIKTLVKKRKLISKRQMYRNVASISSFYRQNSIATISNGSTSVKNAEIEAKFLLPSDNNTTDNYLSNVNTDTETVNIDSMDSIHENVPMFLVDSDFIKNPTDVPSNYNLRSKCQWATSHNITHTALSALLNILSPFHSNLPCDARTLLHSPNHAHIKKLNNGDYCHFGLTRVLNNMFQKTPNPKLPDNKIKISFNFDGLPIFKSNNLQLWSILGFIRNYTTSPFIIGIFAGTSKPLPLEGYLEDFISELIYLLHNGFKILQQVYDIEIDHFICDAPARAYIKKVQSHGGYFSCDKCEEEGDYVNGRVILKPRRAKLRTDKSFELQENKEHHLGISPIAKLKIGFITKFPIDYMHCICLGVTRKLLNSWITGKPRINVKLCGNVINSISQRLLSYKDHIPREFNRKPRSLGDLQRWKATEFRTFLLYVGGVVLKDTVDIAVYEHFLLLHCSVSILVSKHNIQQFGYEYVGNLLDIFVSHSEQINGLEFLVYNVHALSHIVKDCEIYGPLDNFSCFLYENYLGQLKKLVKSPKNPLIQIFRRIREVELVFPVQVVKETETKLEMEHKVPFP
ncbi:hypothetical protein RN001_005882 [Aquatica leii]|uniref:Transposase domain-containing protein n=1 Tax=Aquatica leii TaxID=1421715 RepID=A0AAN7PDB3_9COLE|nr:hypothetical protein RN001_005882 [Aquatica leii]